MCGHGECCGYGPAGSYVGVVAVLEDGGEPVAGYGVAPLDGLPYEYSYVGDDGCSG